MRAWRSGTLLTRLPRRCAPRNNRTRLPYESLRRPAMRALWFVNKKRPFVDSVKECSQKPSRSEIAKRFYSTVVEFR